MKYLFLATITVALATTLQAQTTVTLPDKPEVVLVAGGTFTMGSSSVKNATPHTVTLSTYSIGKYPVTVGQYKKYCTTTGRSLPKAPNWGWIDSHPIVNVNYDDAVAYCKWLSEQYGGVWRLPTEAQWEYAARGGNKSNGYNYSGSNDKNEVAWNGDNTWAETHTVGRKKANELGIFDMSGDADEWCNDWYDSYTSAAQTNPTGAISGSVRVVRGGNISYISDCSVVARDGYDPSDRSEYGGFRVVFSE